MGTVVIVGIGAVCVLGALLLASYVRKTLMNFGNTPADWWKFWRL